MELCGGTHVHRTGMIGSFIIKSEMASSSGVRRIEALTGMNAIKYLQLNRLYIDQITSILKIPIEAVDERLNSLLTEKKTLTQKIDQLEKNKPSNSDLGHDKNIKIINGISFVVNKLDNLQMKEMRSLTDEYKQKFDKCIILNLSSHVKKTIYTVGVTDNITAKYSAQDIVKILNQLTNGKGGGRLDFAQGGGNEILDTEKLISKVEFYIKEK